MYKGNLNLNDYQTKSYNSIRSVDKMPNFNEAIDSSLSGLYSFPIFDDMLRDQNLKNNIRYIDKNSNIKPIRQCDNQDILGLLTIYIVGERLDELYNPIRMKILFDVSIDNNNIVITSYGISKMILNYDILPVLWTANSRYPIFMNKEIATCWRNRYKLSNYYHDDFMLDKITINSGLNDYNTLERREFVISNRKESIIGLGINAYNIVSTFGVDVKQTIFNLIGKIVGKFSDKGVSTKEKPAENKQQKPTKTTRNNKTSSKKTTSNKKSPAKTTSKKTTTSVKKTGTKPVVKTTKPRTKKA